MVARRYGREAGSPAGKCFTLCRKIAAFIKLPVNPISSDRLLRERESHTEHYPPGLAVCAWRGTGSGAEEFLRLKVPLVGRLADIEIGFGERVVKRLWTKRPIQGSHFDSKLRNSPYPDGCWSRAVGAELSSASLPVDGSVPLELVWQKWSDRLEPASVTGDRRRVAEQVVPYRVDLTGRYLLKVLLAGCTQLLLVTCLGSTWIM